MSAAQARRPALPLFLAQDVLHLILMPTEKCNFRCTYCYEDFVQGRMSRSTIDGIRELLASRAPDLRALTFEWFGGEPLLELAILEEIQRHVQGLSREHPQMQTSAGMTTNGYLLSPETLERLVVLGVGRYQVSLDGPAAAHDARRVRADGAGTFERVWANLRAARATRLDFKIRLRVHVDRENCDAVPDLLATLAGELAGDPRFEIFLRPVSRLGGPRDGAIPVLGELESEVLDGLRDAARRLGLLPAATGRLRGCYAAAVNSFVIRSSGEIAKCTVALQHPNNRVGRLHSDGTATLDNHKINGWVRGNFSGDREELRCPMKGFADDPARAGRLPVLI